MKSGSLSTRRSRRPQSSNVTRPKMPQWVSLSFLIGFLCTLSIALVWAKPPHSPSTLDNFKDQDTDLQASEAGYGQQAVARPPPLSPGRQQAQHPQTITLAAHKTPQSSYYYSDYYVPQAAPRKFLPPPQSCPETGRTVCREVKPKYPTDEVFDIVMQVRARRFNITSEFINDSENDETPNLPDDTPPKVPQARGYIVYQTSIHYDPHAQQAPAVQQQDNYGRSYQYMTNSSLYSNFLGSAQKSSIPSIGNLRFPPRPQHPQDQTTRAPNVITTTGSGRDSKQVAEGDQNGSVSQQRDEAKGSKGGKGSRKSPAAKGRGKTPPSPGQQRPVQPIAPQQPVTQQPVSYQNNNQYAQSGQSLEAPPQYNQQYAAPVSQVQMQQFQVRDAITGRPAVQQQPQQQQGYGYGAPRAPVQAPLQAPQPVRAPVAQAPQYGPAQSQYEPSQAQYGSAPAQYGPAPAPYGPAPAQYASAPSQYGPAPAQSYGPAQSQYQSEAPQQYGPPAQQASYQPQPQAYQQAAPYQGQAQFQNPAPYQPQLSQPQQGYGYEQQQPAAGNYQAQTQQDNYASSARDNVYASQSAPQDYMPGLAEQSFRSPDTHSMLDALPGAESIPSVHHAGRYKRQADEDEPQELCETRTMFITPRAALNDRSQWKYVVNVPERDQRFRQVIRVDVCSNPGGSCANTVSSNLPFGQSSRCTQKYIKKKLLAIDEDGQGTSAENFFVPSCCVCQIISNRRK